MNIHISIVNDQQVWDQFIDESSYGTIFHKWDFLRTVEKHTGCELYPLGVYITEELICIIPIFFKKFNGIRMVFSPPPQSAIPCLGFVVSPRCDIMKQSKKSMHMYDMGKLFTEEVDRMNANYVSIALTPKFHDVRHFKWNDFTIDTMSTFYIDLQRPLENIFRGFSSSRKDAIKKLDRYDLELVESDDISSFYDSSVERYRKQGLKFPVAGKEYLEELRSLYPDEVKLYYIRNREGDLLGSLMTAEYKRITMWLGNVKPEASLPVNEFLYWELIRKGKDMDYNELELGGADVPSIAAFKAQFDPSLRMKYRLVKKDWIGNIAEWAFFNIYKKTI
ncbi:GNAT family N-acetyltransferase [Methanolobus halotolerans]|uniref:GNAT family N-acetyltransferase n=1 Tax=Methanolobus halotolerans TaxID=2052935 RepID=A0A4E0PV08_9EURY|nr:GNAT family N-acetyltransferase [Methanolobus halotolerans]TGC07438.1 GNAT family N-acetyltransferase [Methanolobus halotolerans]